MLQNERPAAYSTTDLSDDGLPGLVVLVEEVVGLDEQLTGVLLDLGHPPPPQQQRLVGARLGVQLLVWPAQVQHSS